PRLAAVSRPVSTFAVLATATLLLACQPTAIEHPDPPGRIRLSFFALGDTGVVPTAIARSLQTQMRVAWVLEAEQRRRPADALVLLGDNFYPDGLREVELAARIRENGGGPECGF